MTLGLWLQVDCVTVCADTAAACEVKMKSMFERAELHHPCVLLLRHLELLGQPRDGTETDSRIISSLCQIITALPARWASKKPNKDSNRYIMVIYIDINVYCDFVK